MSAVPAVLTDPGKSRPPHRNGVDPAAGREDHAPRQPLPSPPEANTLDSRSRPTLQRTR
ncbi:hypothetical protein [Lysobacter gummosus]|uniref:hypothetical protein n=1 Tax=Lysobacter gummosus TaxID=262324 RepID=UPI00363A8FA0